jgi:hypothetical protein
MRAISLLILLLIHQDAERSIKGTVMFDNDPMPGATVTIENTGASTMTNQAGEYLIYFRDDLKNITLEVSLPGRSYGAMTRIENIETVSGVLDLGNTPVFLGRSIEATEYNSLTAEQKEDFKPVYHYIELISYISKTQIDTADIRVPCKEKQLKIPFTHIPDGNKVVFNFKDLPGCR